MAATGASSTVAAAARGARPGSDPRAGPGSDPSAAQIEARLGLDAAAQWVVELYRMLDRAYGIDSGADLPDHEEDLIDCSGGHSACECGCPCHIFEAFSSLSHTITRAMCDIGQSHQTL